MYRAMTIPTYFILSRVTLHVHNAGFFDRKTRACFFVLCFFSLFFPIFVSILTSSVHRCRDVIVNIIRVSGRESGCYVHYFKLCVCVLRVHFLVLSFSDIKEDGYDF